MEPHNNLRLLFILLCLVISINATQLSPNTAPSHPESPQPSPSSSSEQTFSYAQFFPASSSDPVPSNGGESAAQHKESSDVGVSSKLHSVGAAEQKEASDPHLLTQQLNAVSASQTKQPLDFTLVSNMPANPNPEVKKICDSTDYPALCLTTVVPLLHGKASVESVLEVSVKASDEFAKTALSLVKKEAAKPGASPQLLSTLKDCKDGYDTAVENFEKTMNAFTTHDVGTMRSMLSAVITFVGDCEDGFAEMQESSPLSTYAKQLTSMTSNCLAIASLMN
ncbi:uncharacterized protein LOC105156846 [Sesamum indicum]|uniref:Uncharacterized protein LOC105156846 n=1 Tax=Sesamum indicum TaxID=4182 RepID=A0A6I9SQA4_SESIN|nr:uncharacterized protein LOC105156846 [Sesamum indicum]